MTVTILCLTLVFMFTTKGQINSEVRMSCSEGLCTVEHPRLKGEELETYEQLLGHSGLNLYEDLHFRNVKIFEQDYLHEVYTANPELPHLVMIHGFGGSSYGFQHLYQHLHKQFQLHSLDAPGIGYSSFGNYQYNCSQTLDYHLDSMEEWRKVVGIQQFYLMGFSMGGYIATAYAERYPDFIKKLFLLSPLGTRDSLYDENPHEDPETKFVQETDDILHYLLFSLKIKPSTVIGTPIIGHYYVKSFGEAYLRLEGQEKDIWIEYGKNIYSQQKLSDCSFYCFVTWPLTAYRPIERIIRENKFNFPIDFYYGTEDWMEKQGALRLEKSYPNINIFYIENSEHQIPFHNPKHLAQSLQK